MGREMCERKATEGGVKLGSDEDGVRGGCDRSEGVWTAQKGPQKNTITIGVHIAELFNGSDALTGGCHDPLEWCHGDQCVWPTCAPQ